MNTRTLSFIVCLGLVLPGGVGAQERVAIPDGSESKAWSVRQDQGATYVKLTQDGLLGKYGRQSLRVDVAIHPTNDWWSVLRCDIGPNPDLEEYNGVRLAVRASAPIPSGGLRATTKGGGGEAAVEAPGQWYAIDIRLPTSAKGGISVEVSLVHSVWKESCALQLHVDGPVWVAMEDASIARLKELHIDTPLVEAGQTRAVIVAPPGTRYEKAIALVQDAIHGASGIRLPVLRDKARTAEPAALLETQNVIALGNMATNPFTDWMYRKWYVLLDLKYPGPQGHVVRSCHNPLGSGHNVVWLGGSDAAGVLEAARLFAQGLKAQKPGFLKVGWLMNIRLGEGMDPPDLDLTKEEFDVYSWRDSFRVRPDGKSIGYGKSTYFGWNPISVAGVLYYMTGRKAYLDQFKAMAMPDPKNTPAPIRKSQSIWDPKDPLVNNYHYRAHLVDCVYDLIEESPLFTDKERLVLANKLLQHQNFFDPSDTYGSPNSSRHGMWHMNCIYTGSRYFAKYYPAPRWTKRMENVRRGFRANIGNPTWGELDTLGWVSTSTEPVFEFFMLDGFDEFVSSGAARTMIGSMETLWTNERFDESNRCLTINLLHKAAYMLKDGRYIWLRERMGFDLDQFRIGQSFWPSPELPVHPPTDIVNRISTFPLPKRRWEQAGKSIPAGEGFQFLAFRSGLTPADDLFQMDGFYGKARTPYHVNPLYTLRMFGGKTLLANGYANLVTVRANGMVEPAVPRAAALKRAVALGDTTYVHTQVPNMAYSSWDRRFLYVHDNYAIVIDDVTGRTDGAYDVTVQWAPRGRQATPHPQDPRKMICREGPVIQCAAPMTVTAAKGSVAQIYSGSLRKGEIKTFANILYWSDQENKRDFTIDPLGEHAWAIHGTGHRAFLALGKTEGDIASDAEMLYLSDGIIFLVHATELVCGGVEIFRCDKPVSLSWDLKRKKHVLQADTADQATLASAADGGLTGTAVNALTKALTDIGDRIRELAPHETTTLAEQKVDWQPMWQTKLSGIVTNIAPAPARRPTGIWVSTSEEPYCKKAKTGTLTLLKPDGAIEKTMELKAAVCSLWPAADAVQEKAFTILAGLQDDTIRAYGDSGDVTWEETAQIHHSFKIGDWYNAPWFSDPGRGNMGVYRLLVGDLWGKGRQEIVAARSVTLEFRELNGKLIERVPTKWGDNTTLAVLRKRGPKHQDHLVLTGKLVSGAAKISVVDQNHELVSNNWYAGVPPGATNMYAWYRRGVTHMAVADLDADGTEEIVVARSGHWNEIDVYSSATSQCTWMASFGPAKKWPRSITGMVVADLTGDGKKEVVVGMLNGWVCAFDCAGESIWQKHFPAAVNGMVATGERAGIVVGCDDGLVLLLDGAGQVVQTAELDGPVTALCTAPGCVLASSRKGQLTQLPMTR